MLTTFRGVPVFVITPGEPMPIHTGPAFLVESPEHWEAISNEDKVAFLAKVGHVAPPDPGTMTVDEATRGVSPRPMSVEEWDAMHRAT